MSSDEVLSLDFETRSACDLLKSGGFRYAVDPTTSIMCASYAFGDDPVQSWDVRKDKECPLDIKLHIKNGGIINAWNAAFERLIIKYVASRQNMWPVPDTNRYRCTMVRALAMGFPGKLESAAPALRLDVRKDADGKRVMQRMSKPRKTHADGTLTWWEDEERYAKLIAYCSMDVEVERYAAKKLFALSPQEQLYWEFDQMVNDRGVYLDMDSVRHAQEVVRLANLDLDASLARVTDGAVLTCSNVGLLKQWLIEQQGLEVDSLAADKITEHLQNDIPDPAREALLLRQEAAKTSTAKLDRMELCHGADNRARGLFQFNAASTARWGGRLIQLQNLPRPTGAFADDNGQDCVEHVFEMLPNENPDHLELFYDAPKAAIASCIRGFITAAPEHTLVAADFESVEGVGLAWLAGEQWKLSAFLDYFQGDGPKLYNVTAGKIFGCEPEEIDKKSSRYLIGKVADLALGYQGGVGAFTTMMANYGLSDDQLASALPTVLEATSEFNILGAEDLYKKNGARSDLSREAWLAADMIKRNWREGHPKIVEFWSKLEEAAESAILLPGEVFYAGKVAYKAAGQHLFCKLPSGRALTYIDADIRQMRTAWLDDDGKAVWRPSVTAMHQHPKTKQWWRRGLYGGLYAENITQAICRDILAANLVRAEEAGWPIVMHVHDEGVAEIELKLMEAMGGLPAFEAVMSTPPPWGLDFPLKAVGWAGKRYRKD